MTSRQRSLRGARRPRVEVTPPYAYSAGPEACELMARAGQQLDPWQADAVELILSFRENDTFACPEYAEIVARQNGKGTILEARALAGFFLLGEPLIMWSAHEYKTAMEAFRRVRTLIRRLGREITPTRIDINGVPIKVNNTNGEESFERLDTGQRIKFLARSKGSGRGFSGDCNIVDEAFAYTRDQQEALMPTTLARPNPQIIYMSTPPLDAASGEPLFALRERAETGTDDALGWRDWGLAYDLEQLDEVDLDDPALWARVNPALGSGRVTVETLARLRRSMSREGFAREVLCLWPRRKVGGSHVIPAELWARLADPDADRPADVAFALHVNLDRTRAAVAYAGRRPDGRLQVGLVDWRAGTGWVVPRLVELRERWGPIAAAVDTRSESLRTELERNGFTLPEDPDAPRRGDLAVPSAADTAAAFGMVVDAVRAEALHHADDAPVNSALAEAKTRPLAGGVTWDHRGPGESGPLKAITLAVWAYETRAHLVAGELDEVGVW